MPLFFMIMTFLKSFCFTQRRDFERPILEEYDITREMRRRSTVQ
jgi:hypothetical protein